MGELQVCGGRSTRLTRRCSRGTPSSRGSVPVDLCFSGDTGTFIWLECVMAEVLKRTISKDDTRAYCKSALPVCNASPELADVCVLCKFFFFFLRGKLLFLPPSSILMTPGECGCYRQPQLFLPWVHVLGIFLSPMSGIMPAWHLVGLW